MFTPREAWTRLLAFIRRDALDRDFDEELATHIELATEAHIRQGMAASEARRLALARLGGIEPSKQLHRESRGLPSLDGLVQDVRYAARSLRRSPGFTLTAIATLAIGIGVNTAVFTLTSGLFKGFALVGNNDRILYIHTRNTDHPDRYYKASYPDFEDWRAQARSFDAMAACRDVLRVNVHDEAGPPESYWAVEVSASTFDLVGQKPILGRDFTSSDEAAGAPSVAILTYGLWERRYARDPSIVGRSIAVNGTPTAVVGVMPQGFAFPNKQDLWIPLTRTSASTKREGRNDLMFAFGRLADGTTVETARAEMEAIGRRLAAAHPSTNSGFVPVVETFGDFFHGRVAVIYYAMCGAVGFVLLIACANLANLMLARSLGRSREISVRIALGAARWRIVRQLVVESLLLAMAGAAFGWWVAGWSLDAYVALAFSQYHPQASPGLYPWFDFAMDHRVLAYLIGISTVTGLLFGLAPARRLHAFDVHTALRDGGGGALGRARGRDLSAALVAGEVALAVVLLAGAGVLIRTVLNITTADVGVDPAGVVSAYVQVGCEGQMCRSLDVKYPDARAQTAFFDRLTVRLRTIPGVASIAVASRPPAFGAVAVPYEIDGVPTMDEPRRPAVGTLTIGATYFETVGAPLVAGRAFSDKDDGSDTPVAIVNRRFAAQQWPGESPLGRRLRLFDGRAAAPWLTIVGVAPNIVQDFTRQSVEPLVYVPHRQQPASAMWVIARGLLPTSAIAQVLRREIHAIEPDLPLFDPQPLALGLAADYRFNYAVLFMAFAIIALLLASLGLYAVVAHTVSRRTQEIGLRMAMGATTHDVIALVLAQGLWPLGVGLAAGIAGALAVTPLLQSVLVHVSPADPITFAAVPVVLIAAAVLGCLMPARRAMRVDPIVALRHE